MEYVLILFPNSFFLIIIYWAPMVYQALCSILLAFTEFSQQHEVDIFVHSLKMRKLRLRRSVTGQGHTAA